MNPQTSTEPSQSRPKTFATAPAKPKTSSGGKPQPTASTGEPAVATQLHETSFRIEAPTANEVLLAGEFTEWEKAPVKLIKGGGGVWHAKVSLPRGRHSYRFLVDGNWQDDPNRPGRETNPFGTTNSLVEVV